MAEMSSAPTKRAMTEIMKLKTSIHHLEGHVRELSRLENGLHMEEEPATAKEKENWKTVLGVIPGKAVVEVLLEYNIQEVSSFNWASDQATGQRWETHGSCSAAGCGNVATLCLFGNVRSVAAAYRHQRPGSCVCLLHCHHMS